MVHLMLTFVENFMFTLKNDYSAVVGWCVLKYQLGHLFLVLLKSSLLIVLNALYGYSLYACFIKNNFHNLELCGLFFIGFCCLYFSNFGIKYHLFYSWYWLFVFSLFLICLNVYHDILKHITILFTTFP